MREILHEFIKRHPKATRVGLSSLYLMSIMTPACATTAGQVEPVRTPVTRPQTGSSEKPKPVELSQYLEKYYPQADRKPSQQGEFATSLPGVNVKWYNFTEKKFDPKSASTAFKYFQALAAGFAAQRTTITAELGDQKVPFKLGPSNQKNGNILLVLNDTDPRPSFFPEEGWNNGQDGLTILNDGYAISVIKSRNTDGLDNAGRLNQNLMIEACQSSLSVTGRPTDSDILLEGAQESICSTFGFYAFQRSQGTSYEDAFEKAQSTGFKVGTGIVGLINIPKATYDQIPVIPPAFSNN